MRLKRMLAGRKFDIALCSAASAAAHSAAAASRRFIAPLLRRTARAITAISGGTPRPKMMGSLSVKDRVASAADKPRNTGAAKIEALSGEDEQDEQEDDDKEEDEEEGDDDDKEEDAPSSPASSWN